MGNIPHGGEQASRDPRLGERIHCHALVRISDDTDLHGRGQMRDVSRSGAFVVTSLGVSLYSQLHIVLANPDGSEGASAQAIVVRTDWDGVGVEWREPREELTCPALGCTVRCLAPEESAYKTGQRG